MSLRVNVVVKDGASRGKFDSLELISPPFGEINSVIYVRITMSINMDS